MDEPWSSLLAMASGALGLKILDWLLNRGKARSDEGRAIREELRCDMHKLRDQIARQDVRIAQLSDSIDIWKTRYFELLHRYGELQQHYIILSTYLNAILRWMRTQGVDTPIPLPDEIDLTWEPESVGGNEAPQSEANP